MPRAIYRIQENTIELSTGETVPTGTSYELLGILKHVHDPDLKDVEVEPVYILRPASNNDDVSKEVVVRADDLEEWAVLNGDAKTSEIKQDLPVLDLFVKINNWPRSRPCLLKRVEIPDSDETRHHPKELFFWEGGPFGPSYQIQLGGLNRLHYFHNRHGFIGLETRRVMIQVNEEKWKEFKYALDEIDAWNWEDQYSNSGVLDGTMWSFKAHYSDHEIDTGGSNRFPDGYYALKAAITQLSNDNNFDSMNEYL